MFAKRLKALRKEHKITQVQLAEILNLDKSTIAKYESAGVMPSIEILIKMANFFCVSVDYLIGNVNNPFFILDNRAILEEINSYETIPDTTYINNIMHLPEMQRVPLIGTIACGKPILANENIEGYIDLPAEYKVDFCLRCKGDSMINARIFDGDIVYIHAQPEVVNGEIAAARIGDEATLKRVYMANGKLTLRAENQLYPDMIYTDQEQGDIQIIGKALVFLSTVL